MARGRPRLTTYTGNFGTVNAPAGNIYGTFVGDGSGLTALNPNSFNASNWNGVDIGSVNYPYGTVYASGFVGDGSGLTNVGGASDLANYTGNIGWQYAPMGAIYATTISGDGGAGLTAAYAYTSGGASAGMVDVNAFFSPTTNWSAMNLGGEGSRLGTVYANYFAGDGSGLTNVGGGGSNTTSDFDTFFAEMMGTTYGGMNVGISTPLNEVHANSFFGDGSNLAMSEGIARIEGSYPWTVKASYNGLPATRECRCLRQCLPEPSATAATPVAIFTG